MRHTLRLVAVLLTAILLPWEPARAATAVETLLADLAKLPAAERQARILDGAKKEGNLAYIESISSKIGTDHEKLFNKAHPIVKTKTTIIGSNEAGEMFLAEEVAGKHLTDLINLYVPDMGQIMERDLGASYETPAIASILPQYRGFLDPKNRWTPWQWEDHGLTYNTDLLPGDKAPKNYFDLCRPDMKKQVSLDMAEIRFLIGMMTVLGEDKLKEWLECLGKNEPMIQDGHTARLTLMMAGDHAASPDQYTYAGTKMAQDNPKKAPFKVAYEAPVIAFANGIVISKHAAHPYSAALYTDWSLGPESQQFMSDNFRAPIALKHPFMPAEATVVPFGMVTKDVANRLFGYWDTYIGKRR